MLKEQSKEKHWKLREEKISEVRLGQWYYGMGRAVAC